MIWQTAAVVVIIGFAIAYLGWRYLHSQREENHCADCIARHRIGSPGRPPSGV